MVKTLRLTGIILALLLVVALVTISCAKATPTSAPAPTVTVTATPAPAPTVTVPAPTVTVPVTVTATPTPTPTPIAKPTLKLPKVVGWGTHGVGAAGYVRVAALSPVIEQRLGVPVRAVPVDTSVARLSMLRAGETQLVMDGIAGNFNVLAGREEFASKEWGPQKIRTVWGFAPANYSVAVMADTPFKTIADLKGKKVPAVPGLKYAEEMLDAVLAFGGLDPAKDVVKVPTAGWVQQHRAAAEGQTDAMIAAPHTPIITELAATPRGVRFFPLPAEDTEGWKRLRATVSGVLAYPMVNQIGIKEAQGMPMASWAMYIVTKADMDEEFVYQVVKAMDELNATYKDKEPTLPFFTAKAIQEMGILDRGLAMIHHPGMIRYLKELGLWKPEHEAWQVQLLSWELAVQGKWLDAIATAEKQGIKVDPLNEQWLKLWDTMRPKVPEFKK